MFYRKLHRYATTELDYGQHSYSLYADIYRLNSLLSCLVKVFARSWQCGVTGSSPVSSTGENAGLRAGLSSF